MAPAINMATLARALLLIVMYLGFLALLPSAHAKDNFNFVALLDTTTPVDVASGVQQIHLAQEKDSTSMAISWMTPNSSLSAPASQVRYGLAPNALTLEAPDMWPYPAYTSGWLHNVELTGLRPNTLYLYQVGDFSIPPFDGNVDYLSTPPEGRSGTLYFRTLPASGSFTREDKEPLRIGVVADIGQGLDAQRSLLRLSQGASDIIIFAGDNGYADCIGDQWDTFFTMLTGVTSFIPLMVAAGNHEVEWLSNATSLEMQVFMSYEKRFKMPQVAPAVITSAPDPLTYVAGDKWCVPSKYQAGYEWGNSYFSYVAGPVLFVHLNSYSYSNSSSSQYGWLLKTLQGVNREVTPWMVAVSHNPWYNSNIEKQNEFQTLEMQAAMEPLFQAYGVNLVLSGHVHTYERSYPVFQFNPTPAAPAYVVVGTGAEATHDNTWLNQTVQPTWSAYRNGAQWGTGTLIPTSRRKMVWQWHWNLDGDLVSADEVTICNTALGYPAYCTGNQFQCAIELRGATKAAWTAESAQLLVHLTSAATGLSASQMLVRKPALRNPKNKLPKERLLGELMIQSSDEKEAAVSGEELEFAAVRVANRKNSLRGAGLHVVLEAFGLPGSKKGNIDAALGDAQAIEDFLISPTFVAAFGNDIVAASIRCEKPRYGTVKF